MGLAASQARFLALTARKADCEFKSTELAQQRLQMTQQMSKISQDYAQALNKTALVWHNPDVESDFVVNYGLLMTPSASNDYSPYFLTSPSGALILNENYAAAAQAAGIPMNGGSASTDAFKKFMNSLGVDQEVISESVLKSVNDVGYNRIAGVGLTPIMDTTNAGVVTLGDMLLLPNIGKAKIGLDALEKLNLKYNSSVLLDTNNGNTGFSLVIDGNVVTDKNKGKTLSIADLFNNNVTIINQLDPSRITNLNDETQVRKATKELMEEPIREVLDAIAKIFGYGDSQHNTGLNVDEASDHALTYAYNSILQRYMKMKDMAFDSETMGYAFSMDADKNMIRNGAYVAANNYNRIGIGVSNLNSSPKCYAALNLSNLVQSFLTYYEFDLDGSNGIISEYYVSKKKEDSNYVTDTGRLSYQYVTKVNANAPTGEEKVANFYSELFNNICLRGWRKDDAIDDPDYLDSMIKNGRYSMNSLNPKDGYFYQSRYNDTGYIVEEVDENAIAIAEAEFSRKKAELTYKEDAIDVKSKKVDAEVSAITTEMESVKNMISNGIQKTFNMFSGGGS